MSRQLSLLVERLLKAETRIYQCLLHFCSSPLQNPILTVLKSHLRCHSVAQHIFSLHWHGAASAELWSGICPIFCRVYGVIKAFIYETAVRVITRLASGSRCEGATKLRRACRRTISPSNWSFPTQKKLLTFSPPRPIPLETGPVSFLPSQFAPPRNEPPPKGQLIEFCFANHTRR